MRGKINLCIKIQQLSLLFALKYRPYLFFIHMMGSDEKERRFTVEDTDESKHF